ncbi:MAG: hypothetical protein JSS49_26500 [Planctomycetes bacterium]|nr:hypothetical protein [Planctomycetota bacterium]
MKNLPSIVRVSIIAILVTVAGCGRPRGVTGGTEGVLHAGGERLADIQLTILEVEGSTTKPIGFAQTRADGTFRLVTDGARGPLRLHAGEYRYTIESAGSPLQIPSELMKSKTTTLKFTWTDGDRMLDLNIPELENAK